MATHNAWSPAGPELVFGVVRPVGTPDERFRTGLTAALGTYGYTLVEVRLSDLLRDEAAQRGKDVPDRNEELRVAALMDVGDDLCQRLGTGSAVALLGVTEIRAHRSAVNDDVVGEDPASADTPVPRTAYLLDSLKRPAEVTHLRRLYGDRCITVSLQASIETRRAELGRKIQAQRPSARDVDGIVEGLIKRDLREADEFGQNTLLAFPMADVFINLEADVASQVESVIDLLFDSPQCRQPTDDEFSMSLADITSTRSAELGLQVGAVLVGEDGTVAGLGHNAHPDPGHTPTYDASTIDIAELVVDALSLLPEATLSEEARREFREDRDAYAAELLAGPLRRSRLRDLIEFQRPVHAEMNALLAALRGRANTTDATMYVTAYPCHHCARHLLALGLTVIYLEPYPKSRAESMYGAAVGARFHPFTGVAPRRYAQMFSVTGDRKDAAGLRKTWGTSERAVALPKLDPFVDPQGIADREISALGALTPQENSDDSRPEKMSHLPTRVGTAGTGSARTTASRTRRPSSGSPSSTLPARHKGTNGGDSDQVGT